MASQAVFWMIEERVGGGGYFTHPDNYPTHEAANRAILRRFGRRFGSAILESGLMRAARYRTGAGSDGPERYPLSAAEEMGRARTETPKE